MGDDWNADMDAWGLRGDQRKHHLWRMYRYHRAIETRSWLAHDRLQRAEGRFALTLLAGFLASVLLLWGFSR